MPAALVGITLLLATAGPATAEPGSTDPNSLASLIAAVAETNQKLHDLDASIKARQEDVNRVIVELENSRQAADTAESRVEEARRAVAYVTIAIDATQKRFDIYAAQSYMQGPAASLLTAMNADDVISIASYEQTLTLSFKQTISALERSRTEKQNEESAAREARENADRAVAEAAHRQDEAVAALTDAKREFAARQNEVERLIAERTAAQAQLIAATNSGLRSTWDPTVPTVPHAFLNGDPVALLDQILEMSATSKQITADMGRDFVSELGIRTGADTGINNGRIPAAYGPKASDRVIGRALSQLGVPYSWGGGTAAGPSRGFDAGADTLGYDCSGLILWAFAGVGILLPHYSGFQYLAGRKVPSSQMRRGDAIFYGSEGSEHVALYLGNGQMLEAPDAGSVVTVSRVRTSGMTPYVVRYIEY
jgi:cell wall-associated NlpC family hydrolase